MGRVKTSAAFAIGYVEAGEGEPAPIVFLHGVGSDKSVWRPQMTYFTQCRRALAFDYPGYGESDPVPEDATRDDYAKAIIDALRALNVQRAHVCGLSLGGVVAIAIYAEAPELCASLIIADSFAVHPEGREIYDRSIAGSANMRAMAEARVDVLLAQPADGAVRAETIATMSRIDPVAYRIGARAVWLADQRDRASRIAAPTLIMCGDDDQATPPILSRELHALIRGSRLKMIAGAGHLANIEQPAQFNRIVDEFIREVEGEPR
jgi:3-oxoadipate enol-lactonase